MGLNVLASLWVLGRPATGRALAAGAAVALAAMLSAAGATLAVKMLRPPGSRRFAAALVILIAGTGGLSALFVAVEMAWRFGHLTDVPLHIIALILATLGIAALYYFLSIAGFLILPLGLPIIFLTAALIAGRQR